MKLCVTRNRALSRCRCGMSQAQPWLRPANATSSSRVAAVVANASASASASANHNNNPNRGAGMFVGLPYSYELHDLTHSGTKSL